MLECKNCEYSSSAGCEFDKKKIDNNVVEPCLLVKDVNNFIDDKFMHLPDELEEEYEKWLSSMVS